MSERIDPKTGVHEDEGPFGLWWQPKRNDDGNAERIDRSTGVFEEQGPLGLGWQTKRDDAGGARRISPTTGVFEEQGIFGIGWQPKRNDAGDAERIDSSTGVFEEQGPLGLGWQTKRNDAGSAQRISPTTGVFEEQGPLGIGWQPKSDDAGSASRVDHQSCLEGGSGAGSSSSSGGTVQILVLLTIAGAINHYWDEWKFRKHWTEKQDLSAQIVESRKSSRVLYLAPMALDSSGKGILTQITDAGLLGGAPFSEVVRPVRMTYAQERGGLLYCFKLSMAFDTAVVSQEAVQKRAIVHRRQTTCFRKRSDLEAFNHAFVKAWSDWQTRYPALVRHLNQLPANESVENVNVSATLDSIDLA